MYIAIACEVVISNGKETKAGLPRQSTHKFRNLSTKNGTRRRHAVLAGILLACSASAAARLRGSLPPHIQHTVIRGK